MREKTRHKLFGLFYNIILMFKKLKEKCLYLAIVLRGENVRNVSVGAKIMELRSNVGVSTTL